MSHFPPLERRLEIGGDGEGGIVVREVPIPILEGADDGFEQMRIRNAIEQVVKEQGPLSQWQLEAFVEGRSATVRRQAKELVAIGPTGVRARKGQRGSIEYYWVEEERAPQPS